MSNREMKGLTSEEVYQMSFSLDKLHEAHNFCRESFAESLSSDEYSLIIVDNTNIKLKDVAPYEQAAVCAGDLTTAHAPCLACHTVLLHLRVSFARVFCRHLLPIIANVASFDPIVRHLHNCLCVGWPVAVVELVVQDKEVHAISSRQQHNVPIKNIGMMQSNLAKAPFQGQLRLKPFDSQPAAAIASGAGQHTLSCCVLYSSRILDLGLFILCTLLAL